MKNGTTYRREILDLSQAAYHLTQSNLPELELRSGRVFFTFADDDLFRRIDRDYHSNKVVGVLDFAAAVRRLRGEMLAIKDDAQRGGRK